MNNLQKLIKIRGMSIHDVAKKIGHGYHITQKVIKRSTYLRVDGSVIVRSNREIEEAVARLLGLTHDEAWGVRSHLILQRLLRQEIKKQTDQRAQDLRQQWLPGDSVPKKRKDGNV